MMGEDEQLNSLEVLRSSDPREYIRISKFQKLAADLDPDKSHPWDQVWSDDYRWVKDPEGVLAVGKIVEDAQADRVGYLFVEKLTESEPTSFLVPNLTFEAGRVFSSRMDLIAAGLPAESRHQFVQELGQIKDELASLSEEELSRTLVKLALKSLHNDPHARPEMAIPTVGTSEIRPTPEQLRDIYSILIVARTKLPPKDFVHILDIVNRYPDPEIFQKKLSLVYGYILEQVFRSRTDTKVTAEPLINMDQPKTFPIKDLLKRKIEDESELREVLATFPTLEFVPPNYFYHHSPKQVEFVDLEKIIGASAASDWGINPSPERGPKRMMGLIRAMEEGRVELGQSGNDYISVHEAEGKFYVDSGRHRVTAMKALGVPFAPMIVSHLS